jgi:hypothetical protein
VARSSLRKSPEKLKKLLEKQERSQRLLKNEDFLKWKEEIVIIN